MDEVTHGQVPAPATQGNRYEVRYWAGAAAAAGTEQEWLEPAAHVEDGAVRVADLRAVMAQHHPGMEAVLARCSILVDGARCDDEVQVAPGARLEVLPPFVGG